jgi:hypothetical protein
VLADVQVLAAGHLLLIILRIVTYYRVIKRSALEAQQALLRLVEPNTDGQLAQQLQASVT